MTTQIDFERYTQIRDRIKAVINQLKTEGVTAAELIEACRSELQILHIEDYRNSKAMNPEDTEDWNPDRACVEMAELFNQADQIISQPHYQDDANADSVDNSGAGSSQTTQANES
jgi:hypothetical protein